MATIGPVKCFAVTLTTGSTSTSALDIGGGYGEIMLGLPSFATNFSTRILVSGYEDGTFRNLYNAPGNTATAATIYTIASGISNCFIPVPVRSQFLKIEVTTATSDTSATFEVICSAN